MTMAEVLMLAFDTINPDPNLDLFAYKMGHVIDIKPDGYNWSPGERTKEKFWIIKVPSMTEEEVQDFISSKFDFTDLANVKQIGIRKWKLDINSVPAAIRNTVLSTGTITVTKSAIQNYMKLVT